MADKWNGFVMTVDERMPPDVFMLVGRGDVVASRELTPEERERCVEIVKGMIQWTSFGVTEDDWKQAISDYLTTGDLAAIQVLARQYVHGTPRSVSALSERGRSSEAEG